MLWWLSVGICALIVICLAAAPVLADTGTYRITDYHVRLEPQNDGTVRITVTQDWVVNSGNIPWITVGLPNSHFAIEGKSDAAQKVTAANSGGFTGVHIDLDKTYLPGQTFRIQFTVLQGNLLERLPNQNQWRIAYTPGWYDNAVIDHMQIDMVSPVDVGSYSSLVPQPGSTANNIFTWEKTNLTPGTHFTVLVESPDGSFLTLPNKTIGGGSGIPSGIIILLVIVGVIVMLSIWAAIRAKQKRDEANTILIAETEKQMADDPKKKEKIEKGFEDYVEKKGIEPDAQGRYYDRGYGDYITPLIWAALLMRNNTKIPPGTSGFTSTGHSSCACACVSCACACACACAGGGAAGCTKKGFHECAQCKESAKLPPNKV